MIDPEMQALLSAYAAGTLTKEETRRLNEAALNNQAIFDAMAEEEPLRAALTSKLVRQGLLHAIRTKAPAEQTRPNYWIWAALASCLMIGAASIAYWPKPEQPALETVAVATKPQQSIPLPEAKPAPKARAVMKAPAVIPESKLEKREAKPVEPPQAPVPAIADLARQEAVAEVTSNSLRERSAPQPAKLAAVGSRPAIEIFNGNLVLKVADQNQIYAFLIDGDSIKPLSTADESRRSIPLGAHSTNAEVWIFITATEDPVLARALTGVLPLPTRNWIKLKTNP